MCHSPVRVCECVCVRAFAAVLHNCICSRVKEHMRGSSSFEKATWHKILHSSKTPRPPHPPQPAQYNNPRIKHFTKIESAHEERCFEFAMNTVEPREYVLVFSVNFNTPSDRQSCMLRIFRRREQKANKGPNHRLLAGWGWEFLLLPCQEKV